MTDKLEMLDALIAVIERTQRRMQTATFARGLREGGRAERDTAAIAMLETTLARSALMNAAIEEVAAGLAANSDAIEAGIVDLDKALADLKRIKPILDGITALLGLVKRIITVV